MRQTDPDNANAASADAASRSVVFPAHIVEAHREFARHRKPGTPCIDTELRTQDKLTQLKVVVDDMPWLVASLRTCLQMRGHQLKRLQHPVLPVQRSANGDYLGLASADDAAIAESFMLAEIEALDAQACNRLKRAVAKTLQTLTIVHASAETHTARLKAHAKSLSDPEQAAFVAWLDQQQFITFGAAKVHINDDGFVTQLSDQTGLLAENAAPVSWVRDDFLPPRLDLLGFDDDLSVFIGKAGRDSPLIRHEHADLVLFAERNTNNRICSFDCILGLFVPGLQYESLNGTPWLGNRAHRVLDASGLNEHGHAGRGLLASLRSLPRDMLLHNRTGRLLEIATDIADLGARPRTLLFGSPDPLGRYWNCLVYLPNDSYTRDLRLTIQRHLETALSAYSTSFESTFSSSYGLARLHFVLRQRDGSAVSPDWQALEARIADEATSWSERLNVALNDAGITGSEASQLVLRYGEAFPSDYRERYSVAVAVTDIVHIETQVNTDAPSMSPLTAKHASAPLAFRLHALAKPVSLSDAIPLIENLGFRIESERPFEIRRRGESNVHTQVFHVWVDGQAQDATEAVPAETSARVSDAFYAVWTERVENDGFNRLVFAAGLNWQQANVFRALGKYAAQTRAPFSMEYMIDALVKNPHLTQLLVRLFEERLSPLAHRPGGAADNTLIHIESALDQITSLDQDRILRRFMQTILAILRTNYWCRDADEQPRRCLSFKFDCAKLPDLPLPRPAFEIFVSSVAVDGVHLRGGSVARGGLRWSDRKEDYRTEVLGLMKAQQVKNAVIVPVGSKGGFYVKTPLPVDRAAANTIVLDAYRQFLSGLLDITDNLDGATVTAPAQVVRRDGDDPYLVVAADKGTATFSDHANAVADDYGFWLGDAFASGGSVGYDHKKMGITARGAWESVKRHFRGLGINTQAEAFTVVGIGDMSGDVFGNGMLLSPHIRLVAAFDHRHIFIDPTPSTTEAHQERARLFALARSSWDDYDTQLISTGGGVWSRQEKSISLSAEARLALGVETAAMTPEQLVSAILSAPVDLLWNGGIGTYVKAASETHADAADRSNDTVRIDATQLRCRVVGEGGNLGFTQRARIEFALQGGLIYTDAIDNAAGVNCSDHEVNIKILLNAAVDAETLQPQERDTLLESMTDEVADLVLADNYRQTGCIDAHVALGLSAIDDQGDVMDTFAASGFLNRAIEHLPDAETLSERAADGVALTRPEISVLVAYAKMSLYEEILASDLPDQKHLIALLRNYFPTPLRARFDTEIPSHRLARQIIATQITNDLVNALGPVWLEQRKAEFGLDGARIADAYLTIRRLFDLDALTRSVDALDNHVNTDVQARLMQLVTGLAERGSHWLLRHTHGAHPSEHRISTWSKGVEQLIAAMPDCLSATPAHTYQQRLDYFLSAEVPADTASNIARLVPLSSALDIVEVADETDQPVDQLAALYFEVGECLGLHWLRDAIAELKSDSRLHKRARAELRNDLHAQHRQLTAEIARTQPTGIASERVARWQTGLKPQVSRYRELMGEIYKDADAGYITLSLALTELNRLRRSA